MLLLCAGSFAKLRNSMLLAKLLPLTQDHLPFITAKGLLGSGLRTPRVVTVSERLIAALIKFTTVDHVVIRDIK